MKRKKQKVYIFYFKEGKTIKIKTANPEKTKQLFKAESYYNINEDENENTNQ